jgi:hypothetical protein
MRILTAIGEIGVQVGEKSWKLRPSLYAMSLLPDPVKAFAALYDEATPPVERWLAAVDTLAACCDEDVTDLVGHTGDSPDEWTPGELPAIDCVLLAMSLIRHGVVGVVPELPDTGEAKREYVQKFEPQAFAAMAMAHLGLSEAHAWDMTVTGFTLAMRAKFPQPKSDNPTLAEAEKVSQWLDQVNKLRERRH